MQIVNRTGAKGFTIVELLIVIVIIAILAAITIVAYNGVTNRANTSSAKSAAISAVKKVEAYNAENGAYPTTSGALTGAAATTTYYLTGVSFTTDASDPTGAPTTTTPAGGGPNRLKLYTCTTGIAIAYWDYTSSAWAKIYTGGGTAATCTTYKNT